MQSLTTLTGTEIFKILVLEFSYQMTRTFG